MKKSDLKPGTKVLLSMSNEEYSEEIVKYFYDEYDDNTLAGTILDKPAEAGKVWISWDESNNYSEDEEAEVYINILTLESDRSKIEQEFKNFSKGIKAKIKEAAKLVLEANKMAKEAHASSLADMYDAVAPLISAMDNSGWRSSSWGC